MINYTPQSQLKLDLFEHPFETTLDNNNRWVKLASIIPWDDLANVYATHLDRSSGRKSVNIRTVIGALIVKHKLCLDDRGTIEIIQENPYLQYFCGLKGFSTSPIFDPSLFVDIRKRLGGQEFEKFNTLLISKAESIKPHQSRIKKKSIDDDQTNQSAHPSNEKEVSNKGSLQIDATVADQEITYPNDVKLLNTVRENLERMIDYLYDKSVDGNKPRDYRRVARKDYLNFAKKKRKSNREIRAGIRKQLQYVNRDLKYLTTMLSCKHRTIGLTKRDKELHQTAIIIYAQQYLMYKNKTRSCPDRIVNLFQSHVRPIVRGKEKSKTEFGAKLDISLVDGFDRIGKFSWDAFNESTNLKSQLEDYKSVYGRYPAEVLIDQIYLTRENRKLLDLLGIRYYGKPLGRRPKKEKLSSAQRYRVKKKASKRNQVEGKFGQGKRKYGLNNVNARIASTSESWINAIFFVMNLEALLKLWDKFPNFLVFFDKGNVKSPQSICRRIKMLQLSMCA